jgi:D-alanine-D-alanine ligase
MRIALLHDDVLGRPDAAPDERGVLEAVEAVDVALRDLGHQPVRITVGTRLESWVADLSESGAELVFNLCEGAGGSSALEPNVAAVVELLGLPVTGSSSETLALARRKDRVNALLATAGIPVPPWTAVQPGAELPAWERFPAIVKPAAEDASVGITQQSVVRDAAELSALFASNDSPRSAVLIQEFLCGREIVVGILGERVLPVAEIEFDAMPEGAWPLVTYRAKWEPGSDEDAGSAPRCPAHIPDAMRQRAVSLALGAWTLVGGRGYGRVDMRADAEGRLHVLEVNPNPDLTPSAGLTRMAAADGCGYVDLIERIVREAAS